MVAKSKVASCSSSGVGWGVDDGDASTFEVTCVVNGDGDGMGGDVI